VHRIVFVTVNEYKEAEFRRLFKKHGIEIVWERQDNDDIQHLEIQKIAEHKATKAFEHLGRPLFVDATGLGLDALRGLPGGFNSTFWSKLGGAGMCELADKLGDRRAFVEDWLCICDGKKLYPVPEKQTGEIAKIPIGKTPFHIDSIFVPTGCSDTLGALGEKDRDIYSYRTHLVEKAAVQIQKVFGRK
jgi:XTP/dITP diphosphohydrolase